MAIHTTYTDARKNLAKLLDRVTGDREVVFIRRRGREKVALVAADELEGLMETAHLLRSPRNATRLLTALRRALLVALGLTGSLLNPSRSVPAHGRGDK